jgi:menaquinone-specific isochorismate synthase
MRQQQRGAAVVGRVPTSDSAAAGPRLDGHTGTPVRPRWVRSREIDDAEAARLTTAGELCWLTDGHELAGWGAALRIGVGTGRGRFNDAAETFARHVAAMDIVDQAHAATRPLAFCSFTFDPSSHDSVMVVPRVVVRRRAGRAWLTMISDQPVTPRDLVPPPVTAVAGIGRVRYAGTTATEIDWIDAVDRAVRRIRHGEAEKVVLARDRVVYSHEPFEATALLRRLRASFPSCFTFHVAGLIGASPELLIRREGAQITSLVLAGTARRGRDATEDSSLGDALLRSAKDLAEHRPAVTDVRGVLDALVTQLDVDDHPTLLRLANVQHLATRMSGRLHTPVHALHVAGLLHPTAAVGGTPRDVALAMIAELETIDRGRYAGPVGWVDAAGDGELAIALRCAQLTGARARLFAGAGIVADSLPENELEETRLKLRAMQSAFEG